MTYSGQRHSLQRKVYGNESINDTKKLHIIMSNFESCLIHCGPQAKLLALGLQQQALEMDTSSINVSYSKICFEKMFH